MKKLYSHGANTPPLGAGIFIPIRRLKNIVINPLPVIILNITGAFTHVTPHHCDLNAEMTYLVAIKIET
jgi:hypothetical protein